MATKTFTTMVQLEQYIKPLIQRAIENTSEKVSERLQIFIRDEYYFTYKPLVYQRTYQFLNSVSNRLLSPTQAEIYMDEDKMNYGDYWDGETQLYMADAGFHGNVNIYREGFFWKDFMIWSDENIIRILREELAKQGIMTIK